jgi:hypothetical protein
VFLARGEAVEAGGDLVEQRLRDHLGDQRVVAPRQG